MEKHVLRKRLVQVFAIGVAIGLLLAVIRHAVLEVQAIRALLFE